MSPEEQQQRVLCEVLQGYGYAVHMGAAKVWWMIAAGGPMYVWWQPGEQVQHPAYMGPVCDTLEDAIAWVLANVPRATTSPAAP